MTIRCSGRTVLQCAVEKARHDVAQRLMQVRIVVRHSVWIAGVGGRGCGVEFHSFWLFPQTVVSVLPRGNPSQPIHSLKALILCIQLKTQMLFTSYNTVDCECHIVERAERLQFFCYWLKKNHKYRSFSFIRLGSGPWIFQPEVIFWQFKLWSNIIVHCYIHSYRWYCYAIRNIHSC